MFATKKCLLAWCETYLNKVNKLYLCPSTGDIAEAQKIGGYWRIKGWSEERIWEVEDLKVSQSQ